MSQPGQYDEKLSAILAAATRVFAEKGYHNASIRDIARETGVSLSGLYYYFQSKEELLYLIQDHAFETLTRQLDGKLGGVTDPRCRLHIFIDNHLRYFVENTAEMKVISHEMNTLEGEYRQALNRRKRQLTEIATDLVLELRPDADLDPRIATFALFGMMNWIYHWYRPDGDVPVETLVGELERLFVGGYLNPAPHDGRLPDEVYSAALVGGLTGRSMDGSAPAPSEDERDLLDEPWIITVP